jgi:hypothetical protein
MEVEMPDVSNYLPALQCVIGVLIALGGLLIQAAGADRRNSWVVHLITTGLVGWGVWFALLGFQGHADSLPGIAMGIAVAYVVVIRGRQVRGILDGEDWWPPNASVYSVSVLRKRPIVQGPRFPLWWVLWALFGNVDDGLFGDDRFNPSGSRSVWTAVRWWFRNPFHNLFFYVIGVADITRIVTGRWGGSFYRPGGGFLTCWTTAPVFSSRYVVHLPFASVTSAHLQAYVGWRPSGGFGIAMRVSRKARPEWLL